MAVGNMFRQRRQLGRPRTRNPFAGDSPVSPTMRPQSTQFPVGAYAAASPMGFGGLAGQMMLGVDQSQRMAARQPKYEQAFPLFQLNPQSPYVSPSATTGAVRNLTRDSRLANPVQPPVGYADSMMSREAARDADITAARMAPIYDSSGQAGQISRGYSGVMGPAMSNAVNGYVGTNPIAMTPQDKFNTAQAAAQRYMGGGAAADPTGLGRRFGAGSPLVSGPPQVTDAQRQQASQDFLQAQNPMGAFDPNQKVFGRRQADGTMAYTDRQTAMQDYARQNPITQEQKDYMQEDEDRRMQNARDTAARRDQFKKDHGGMNERQFRRSQKEDARTEKKFRQAVEAGLNPMSPQAQALFPDQAAKTRAGMSGDVDQNPMAVVGKKFGPKAPKTADSVQEGVNLRKRTFAGTTGPDGSVVAPPSPYFAGMGLTGDEADVGGLHDGIVSQLEQGIEPSPEDLRMLYGAVATYNVTAKPGESPFRRKGWLGEDAGFTMDYTDIYEGLAKMENPTDEDLQNWWAAFKDTKANPPSKNWKNPPAPQGQAPSADPSLMPPAAFF